jgi:two-component system, chemotaxis family, sensor histidine kinase and response regulator PixL
MTKLMVVEDDADLRSAMAEALEELEFEVGCAFDGAMALHQIREDPELPALIILDLVMPNMNGLEFLEERRSDPRLSGVPVLVLSGDPELSRKACLLGAELAVPKPLHLLTFVDVISGMIGSSGSEGTEGTTHA